MQLTGRKACAFVMVIFLCNQALLGVPTFQVYIDGATADDIGSDYDTWFVNSGTFDLIVAGAFGPKTDSLSEVTLVLSVPQGQSGTCDIVGGATLLTTTTSTSYGNNPNGNADVDLLSDVSGNDGYSAKDALPSNFDNHYPFQSNVSDFLLYSIGEFSDVGGIHNYNASDGTISAEGNGEEKVFNVSIAGFSHVHFDVYGYESKTNGKSSWQINPGSHDATSFTPAPSALMLSCIGLGMVGWLRRLRTL